MKTLAFSNMFIWLRSKRKIWTILLASAAILIGTWAFISKLQQELRFYKMITSSSTFRDTSVLSLLGDTIVRMALGLLPVFVALLLIVVALLPRTWHDLKFLAKPIPQAGTKFHKGHELAVSRFTLLLVIAGAAVGAGSWMQDTTSKRIDVTKQVKTIFDDPTIFYGRQLLSGKLLPSGKPYCDINTKGTNPIGHDCEFCRDLNFLIRKDGNIQPPSSANDEALRSVRSAINATELVLYLRHTKAMSETEFYTLWAGLVDEIINRFREHYDQAQQEMKVAINKDIPLIIERMELTKDTH